MSLVFENLNQLAKIKNASEDLSFKAEQLVQSALLRCPDLERRYDEAQKAIAILGKEGIELTSQINEVVIAIETSIKGDQLQAVFMSGRTTWDTKKLEGYAAAHPEINQFKKVGNPSVSIQEVKETKED